jgi:hypothetical protein
MNPLTPQEIICLHGSGFPTPQHSTGADRAAATLPISNTVSLEDYSADVAELATNKNLLWYSTDPTKFKKNGKINFLHLDDEGMFTLTVIKPGTKKQYQIKINKADVHLARAQLAQLQEKNWDKSLSSERWSSAQGDVDGNTYTFERVINIV